MKRTNLLLLSLCALGLIFTRCDFNWNFSRKYTIAIKQPDQAYIQSAELDSIWKSSYEYAVLIPEDTDGIERSPWFLPSIGQWFDMLVNICGRSPENFQHNTGNGLQDEKWGQETLDKLEGQLFKVGKSLPQFNVNYRLGFSCSSQYDKDRSWMLLWHIDDPLYKWERVCLQGYNKTSAWHVRPFFAF